LWMNDAAHGVSNYVAGTYTWTALEPNGLWMEIRLRSPEGIPPTTYPTHTTQSVMGNTLVAQGSLILVLSGSVTASGATSTPGEVIYAQSSAALLGGNGSIVVFV